MHTGRTAVALLLLLSLAGHAGAQQATQRSAVAVIANREVPENDVTFGELRRIFLADRQFWTSELRITLIVPGWRSKERETLLSRIYERDEAQYRHYWIAKVFTTEAVRAPKAVSSREVAASLVTRIRGAVTLVDAARIPPGVKVLTVDGKRPGEDGYPLQ